jgi:hypothetical protein
VEWWHDSGLVFTQPNGRPIDSRADLRDWQQRLADVGVAATRSHNVRHPAATNLGELGVMDTPEMARTAVEAVNASRAMRKADPPRSTLEGVEPTPRRR